MIGSRSSKVDPRGCGGDFLRPVKMNSVPGRSPRVRGRHLAHQLFLCMGGSIPAGAGETEIELADRINNMVDPRGCGGDSLPVWRAPSPRGRSPRVRGRQNEISKRIGTHGSIPAGAGETAQSEACQSAGGVDPRGCGGDIDSDRVVVATGGRSPRVRGRLFFFCLKQCCRRSIPAGAGETGKIKKPKQTVAVDPRGCGGDPWRL